MRVLWLGAERIEPVLWGKLGLDLLDLLNWVLLKTFATSSSGLLDLGWHFGSFNLVLADLLPLSCFVSCWAVPGEVPINLAFPIFEGQLFVV